MYIADLHIHSKYSRATSQTCVPAYLAHWAAQKGITLLGTGDFTHPAWRALLQEQLQPAEEGLYTLKADCCLEGERFDKGTSPRFVVSGEISSIYKKDGKVRKVHNLILLPSLEAAENLSRRLEAIGNIHSDGRPILGLDSRDLLEITLEACKDAVFIPAHIWTPHFSMFGAFSGFDTIEACFGDLTPYIHALETGLSSDPPMNWRLSALDGYTLVSNSDAHSPSKLGREANLLDTDLSYPALANALQYGQQGGFAGTIEFFPEEGKYHFDGHRSCHLCLKPSETEKFGGRCPICGKKITIGVQHRVEQLADREEGFVPTNAAPFESLAPLPEVIAASTGQPSGGVKVSRQYEEICRQLGSEFYILREAPLSDIQRAGGACIAEGIRRLRTGKVKRIPGYDGAYGTISLLDDAEIRALSGQVSFLSLADLQPAAVSVSADTIVAKHLPDESAAAQAEGKTALQQPPADDLLSGLNAAQAEAVLAADPVIAVVAGPGTGKTKTLVAKIAYLIERRGVKPSEITAVTFTNKAAGEMRTRLEKQLGGKRALRGMTIGTFHAVCLQLLKAQDEDCVLLGESDLREIASSLIAEYGCALSPVRLLREISKYKNGLKPDGHVTEELCAAYTERLEAANGMDLDDLLLKALSLWVGRPEKLLSKQTRPFRYLLIDEFQDINQLQFRLVRAWSEKSKELFVIGDPDQAIYGFRGSDAACFQRLQALHPELHRIQLVQNYRSTPQILESALAVMSAQDKTERTLTAQRAGGAPVHVLTAQSDLAEGIYVAKQINQIVGGMDMLDAQGTARRSDATPRSFSEIAVLYRTHRQEELLEKCLRKEGIPYRVGGSASFLSDDAVCAALAFFRFLLEPADQYALQVCLKYIQKEEYGQMYWQEAFAGDVTDRRAADFLAAYPEAVPLTPLIQEFLPRLAKEAPVRLLETWARRTGCADGEAIQRLLCTAVFHKDMRSFLQTVLLGEEGDLLRGAQKRYTADAVTLLTLHGCKGLEFPVVFLCGVRQGMIPLETGGYPTDLAEERRLFYVGMTRAQEELYLLTAPEPSAFLQALPKKHVQYGMAAHRQAPAAEQLCMF